MSGNISFTGIGGGGGEFNQIIDALVNARRKAQIEPMEDWKREWQGKIETVNIVDSVISSFFTTVKTMDRVNEMNVKAATSSNTAILTAAADSTAMSGAYTIQVNELARAEMRVSTTTVTAEDGVINSTGFDQFFDYQYGNGAVVSVTVPDGTTLSQLVNLINTGGLNPGVTASILQVAEDDFRLVLSGQDPGKDITVHATTNLANFAEANFGASIASQAEIEIGGVTIARNTNVISDIISGLTLTLTGTGTATVTVGTDREAIMAKLEEFREGFNNVRTIINAASRYDPESETAAPLMGNYALQIIKSRLDSLVSGVPPGFNRNSDTYVNLMQLGFYTDTTEGSETQGLLLLDRDKLSKALDDDPDAVVSLLSAYFQGVTDDNRVAYGGTVGSGATAGTYVVEVDLTIPGSERGRFKFEGGDFGPWYNLEGGTAGQWTLTGGSGPETGIILNINGSAIGATTVTVSLGLRNGVITEISNELDRLLRSTVLPSGERVEGPLQGIVKNYTDIIKSIDKRIEAEERRIESFETLLRQRFARLDSLMGRMGGMSAALGGIVNQM